ncbi:MAG: hypothetical protein AB9873_03800 [Syntrophobacteraceae bacterium]
MSQQHLYDYYIDELGRWFCEGNLVSDPELFRILSRSLFVQSGAYFIRCEGEVHPVRVADVPLWIRYVHIEASPDGRLHRVELELEDGRRELLDAETLSVRQDGAGLYALATSRKLPARFGKSAYYELTRYLTQDCESGPFYLVIGGRRFELRETGPPLPKD